jgi:two-component system sensor histidine kinase DesK
VDGVSKHAHGTAAVVGYLLVAVFAAVYLTALQFGWGEQSAPFWTLYAVGIGLTVVEGFFAGEPALVFLVYLGVLTVTSRNRWTAAIVITMTLAGLLAAVFVPGWGGQPDWGLGFSILLVALAMFGFFRIIAQNHALTAARAEVARLAAENERSRIARDLHDLLGHSLTTITVKAGLARRLAETGDAERALAEISAVEQLSRRTLSDVRAAVSAQADVTLADELATAREVLRAAGVIAELPPTVAETDPALSELFGWVVREGVTNVVRHAHATHVRVMIGPRFVEITDDGAGGPATVGNGLRGLRERAEALGGALTATGGLSGFRLRVEVPDRAHVEAPAVAESPSRVP